MIRFRKPLVAALAVAALAGSMSASSTAASARQFHLHGYWGNSYGDMSLGEAIHAARRAYAEFEAERSDRHSCHAARRLPNRLDVANVKPAHEAHSRDSSRRDAAASRPAAAKAAVVKPAVIKPAVTAKAETTPADGYGCYVTRPIVGTDGKTTGYHLVRICK